MPNTRPESRSYKPMLSLPPFPAPLDLCLFCLPLSSWAGCPLLVFICPTLPLTSLPLFLSPFLCLYFCHSPPIMRPPHASSLVSEQAA